MGSAYETLVPYVRVAERTADEKVERGFLSQLLLHGQEFDRNTEPFRAELKTDSSFSYKLAGCASWNCIFEPTGTVKVPTDMPYRTPRAVFVLLAGWTPLTVLIGTMRPLLTIPVRFRVSGLELRALAREASILPKCEEIKSRVRTTKVVPAGIVAAFRGEAATHAQLRIIIRINVFRVIFES